MGWASKAAEEVEAISNERSVTRRWALFIRERINSEADELWEELAERIAADMSEFDKARNYQSEIRVERADPTTVKVSRLTTPLQILEWHYTPKTAVRVIWNGKESTTYSFGVDDKGRVWFLADSGNAATLEEISQDAFRQMLASYRNPFL